MIFLSLCSQSPFPKQCSPRLPAQPPLASSECGSLHCFSTGNYHWSCNLWVLIISLFFFPVMLPSVLPRLAQTRQWGSESVSWCLETSLFSRIPSWGRAPSLPLLSLFLSFIFFPTSFRWQWAAFLGAWCPLLAFRSCFVEFTQHLNVLLMNLWGRKWSPRPIPWPF